jgi:uncharacterized repeat protein (TIGR02543 family)
MKHKLLSVALITVLLCLVLGNSIGCTTITPTTYTLTMNSTAGGSITPAVGTYKYAAATWINLNATPNSGYRFVKWTAAINGNITTNTTDAQTNFQMPSHDVTVTAHFALGTLIENVPDTSWPTPGNPPNFCAPLAMVNILGYWDEVMGNSSAYNVTAWLQPSNLNGVANLVGYYMDTNDHGSAFRGNGLHAGTYAKDITPGNLDYVLSDVLNPLGAPPFASPGKVSHVWTGADDYVNNPHPGVTGFPFIKAEIDTGRPLVVCYTHWNLNFGMNVTDPQSGKVISVYQWGPQTNNSTNPPENWTGNPGEYYIGHAVTCVGYILNWNPLGLGAANYTIVHDTWATTPENIAVFWPGPWNSSHSVLP